MKSYQCQFCKKEGYRKEIRACIMSHIKTNKVHSANKQEPSPSSNISEKTLKKDLKGVEDSINK